MQGPEVRGWLGLTVVPSLTKTTSNPSISDSISLVCRWNRLTPLLARTHAVSAINDSVGARISMHVKPRSTETNMFVTGPICFLPGAILNKLEPSTFLGLSNSLQYGVMLLP